MLTTEIKCTRDNNVFILRPLGNTFLFNGVGAQEFEAHRCTTTCSYSQGRFFAPVRATRAEVISIFFEEKNNIFES